MSSVRVSLIIIGGGITGLSAAITWALHRDPAGQPVLVVEGQPSLGGCVTSFRRRGFLFDTAQLIPDVSELLDYLGVELPLQRFGGVYARLILVDPQRRARTVIAIPTGVDQFHASLVERYPHQRAPLGRFFALASAIFDELTRLKVHPRWHDLVLLPFRCRHIVGHAGHTFRELVAGCGISDPELLEVLEVFAAFSGLPSERVAALLPVSAMMTSLTGSFRPARAFIDLPYAMKRRLERLGGTVWTNRRVTQILTEDGRARGVRLADGETVLADHVVTTIDPVVAMRELVGLDQLRSRDPSYAARIEALRMSPSSVHISLGLSDGLDLRGLGLDGGYNVISTGHGTFARLFRAFDEGRLGYSPDSFHTAVICPSLVTGGKPAISIRVVPAPMADWAALRASDPAAYAERKRAVADFFLEQVERFAIPDLRRHVEHLDVATPATFARYTGSLLGQNYDMAAYPDNFGRKRLAMRTPIAGLYQPKLSHGIWPCMTAGLQVVDMILGGEVMHGYSRYSARRDGPAPRSEPPGPSPHA